MKQEGFDKQVKKLLENKLFKGKETMIVIVLIGVVLAVIAFPISEKEEEETSESIKEVIESDEVREEYANQLEQRLETILSQMEGVGRVEVMITLQASSKEVIEKDFSTQQNSNQNETSVITDTSISKEEITVYTDTKDGSVPYVVQEIYPEVEGVLVVAEGGDDSYTNLAIVEAIQALFGVDVHKIKIVKMNTD